MKKKHTQNLQSKKIIKKLDSDKVLRNLQLMWEDISNQIFCLQKALANHRKDSTDRSNKRRGVS